MLVNQLPFFPSLLKDVGLTDNHGFCIAALHFDVDPLDGADHTHVAVHHGVGLEEVNLAGFEAAEDLVKEVPRWLYAS